MAAGNLAACDVGDLAGDLCNVGDMAADDVGVAVGDGADVAGGAPAVGLWRDPP